LPKTPRFIGPGAVDVAFEVNGDGVSVHVPPHRTLLDTLRETLGLTGAKRVCDEGTCGACTVLMDGEPVYACMTLAVACAGRAIETVEGLSTERGLHPVQEAFIEHDAYQCGFCTPGQVMSIVSLLRADPKADEEAVKRAVAGNLCRCGAYANIVAAGVSASKKKRS
jgi:xanthine dehydrogenase YagT iron-sulfur-binding subunit